MSNIDKFEGISLQLSSSEHSLSLLSEIRYYEDLLQSIKEGADVYTVTQVNTKDYKVLRGEDLTNLTIELIKKRIAGIRYELNLLSYIVPLNESNWCENELS